MSVIGNPLLLSPEGYQIERSVRLRSSASAYFNRTPASAGNRKTWTWSGWVKRGTLGSGVKMLFASYFANNDNSQTQIRFESDRLELAFYNIAALSSNAVFRDASAWYHVLVAFDSTQSTASNRVAMYVNGVQLTSFYSDNRASITQNSDYAINAAQNHFVGYGNFSNSYFDGYLTDVNFIDGQALTPSSFGEFDAITGVWKPKKYAGTYGTNGFYLNFSDPASTTTIGYDYSGNGNNWTPNNISVTAGVTYDSMIDVPTPYADGGNGRGNYCVMNPLDTITQTLSNANLTVTASSSVSSQFTRATMQIPTTGKWYWECVSSGATTCIGITVSSVPLVLGGSTTYNNSIDYQGVDGNKNVNGSVSAYGATFGANDVIGVAVDADDGTLTFYKNNVSQGSISITVANGYSPNIRNYSSTATTVNFGQRPFAYTPPTGFKALNTQNLPEPTIKKGNEWFDATTYTGTGSARSVVNAGGFQPDLVWVKGRSVAYSHLLTDSVRGATKRLVSDSTAAEVTDTDTLTAFNSNGFSWGTGIGGNQNAATYVAWQWKANGAGVSNTDGSITSTVSAGVTQGFSVVTYTGTGANATVGHGLGVAPAMVIVKTRSVGTYDWCVYHKNLTSASYYIPLSNTSAQTLSTNVWNAIAPTSSVFSVGTSVATNQSGQTLVAYCFAEVAGYSKFGSYTGNGSADGPFVFCGFRPAFILVKQSSASGENWEMWDSERGTFNISTPLLYANLSNAETAGTAARFDVLSNGFKVRSTNAGVNTNGATYIYAAFAEHPFKNSLAR